MEKTKKPTGLELACRESEKSKKKRSRKYSKHGLTAMKTALSKPGARAIDRRTKVGRALAEWRNELLDDLGGADAVSTQQLAIVDLAVKTKLLLDSVDAWLLKQPSLVNSRKKSLLPVVRERQQLADSLARYMAQLGLERRLKPVPSLSEYFEQKAEDHNKAD
jgi:hypothetical protein